MLPGMSGSERKQLHIACGVVAGANLVFLDEPTSGLVSDAFALLWGPVLGAALHWHCMVNFSLQHSTADVVNSNAAALGSCNMVLVGKVSGQPQLYTVMFEHQLRCSA